MKALEEILVALRCGFLLCLVRNIEDLEISSLA